jgi:hypothetical protein
LTAPARRRAEPIMVAADRRRSKKPGPCKICARHDNPAGSAASHPTASGEPDPD